MDEVRGPLHDSTFPEVLAAARSGANWAVESLFMDLQPRVLRFLRSTEPRAADDLAGEVWLAMARGISTFEGDLAGFRAWVFTIARRRLADHRRPRRAGRPNPSTTSSSATGSTPRPTLRRSCSTACRRRMRSI